MSSIYQLKPDRSVDSQANSNSTVNNLQNTNGIDMEMVDEKSNRKRIVQTVVDLVVIVIVFVIFVLIYFLMQPRIRYFTCNEDDIWFPYFEDTVPFWVVGVYGTIAPILFIIMVELLNAKLLPFQKGIELGRDRRRKFFICTFHALSLFVLGIGLTLCLTEIGKRWVGRLRPHFFSVCKPDLSKIDCLMSPSPQSGQIYNSISTGGSFCTGSLKDVTEARLSFPSGHSSYSWYCMIFLIVYLEARLFLLQLRYLKPLIQLAAFSAAFTVCLSRISDYHHRGTDVLGGSVLGIVIALFVTILIGRVLWTYEHKKRYYDFDQKPFKMTRSF